MSAKCAVYNCDNCQSSRLSFFRFPKDDDIRRKWIQFCRREKSFDPKKSALMCIEHFTTDDFTNNMQYEMGLAARLRIKPDAVPTINTKCRTSKMQRAREERKQKREYKQIVEKLLQEYAENENQSLENEIRKINNFENDPAETTEILIERIPRSNFNKNAENPLEDCDNDDNSFNKNVNIKIESCIEDEMERIHNENSLESEIESMETANHMESELEILQYKNNLQSEMERLHSDHHLKCELEKLKNENYVEPIDERLHNEKHLESEVEKLKQEVEFLRSENERLQNSEKKYIKTLAAVKKKYLTTLETAHRKYLESEDKYLYEINTLKERLEREEYESFNVDNKDYDVHEV